MWLHRKAGRCQVELEHKQHGGSVSIHVTSPAGLQVCLPDFSTSCFPLTFITAATRICAVQVTQLQTFVCKLLTVFFMRCHCSPQWQTQYWCSSKLSMSALSFSYCTNGWHCEENVLDVGMGVVKSWIMNSKSSQCCWLGLRLISFSSKAICLLLQRRG